MSAIFLIGFRGSGKSALGKRAAEILEVPFVDLDEIFRGKFGEIKDFVVEKGWDEFRQKEAEILQNFAHSASSEQAGFSGIIATGGGIIELEKNREFLAKQKTIFIDLPLEVLLHRLTKKAEKRPRLEAGKDLETEIRENFLRRLPLYQKSAKFSFSPNPELSKTANAENLAGFLK